MEELRTILVTAPDAETGARIGRLLVEERLAACVNIVPKVTSIYRWEGDVLEEQEVLMIVKTTAARTPALTKRTVELHPYDVPEVLAMPVLSGFEPYMEWVRDGSGDFG